MVTLKTISISLQYRDKFEEYWNSLPKNQRSEKVCEAFIKLMEGSLNQENVNNPNKISEEDMAKLREKIVSDPNFVMMVRATIRKELGLKPK